MSNWTAETWRNGGRLRSQRFIQRARHKGVRLSFWQRQTAKKYRGSERAISGVAALFAQDVWQALRDLNDYLAGSVAELYLAVQEEAEELQEELERETPFDPDGPNDPPLHARDSWRLKVKEVNDQILVSISNPKDYIGFLEERGGRHDHPGADDPGWIEDAFNSFALRIRGRIT